MLVTLSAANGCSHAGASGMSMNWGTGEHPRMAVAATTSTMPATQPDASLTAPSASEVHRFTEDIGGSTADVWRNRFGSTFYTGGQWTRPPVWVVGKARSAEEADLEITIIRTMRFAAP